MILNILGTIRNTTLAIRARRAALFSLWIATSTVSFSEKNDHPSLLPTRSERRPPLTCWTRGAEKFSV